MMKAPFGHGSALSVAEERLPAPRDGACKFGVVLVETCRQGRVVVVRKEALDGGKAKRMNVGVEGGVCRSGWRAWGDDGRRP